MAKGTGTGSVGNKVPKPGALAEGAWVGGGEGIADGIEVGGIRVGCSIVGGIGATVPCGTVAQPGALVEGPCAGVGAICTGGPELIGTGVGGCTVAGIGAMVAGGGVCEPGASL